MSLAGTYHDDLNRLIVETERVHNILPACQVYFSMDNFSGHVVVEGVERKDLHRLSKELRQTFLLERGCNGFYRAFNNKEVFAPDSDFPNLTKQNAGVPIFVRTNMRCKKCDEMAKSKTSRDVVKYILLTNPKATIWRTWRFLLENFWVGRGYNPDYTQACTSGTCAATGECLCKSKKCQAGFTCSTSGACGCPAPSDPNSSQTVACTASCISTNTCKTDSSACTVNANCGACGVNSTCAGTCGYTCNSGFVWTGALCVPGGNVRDRVLSRSLRHNRSSGTLKYSPSSALFAKLKHKFT